VEQTAPSLQESIGSMGNTFGHNLTRGPLKGDVYRVEKKMELRESKWGRKGKKKTN